MLNLLNDQHRLLFTHYSVLACLLMLAQLGMVTITGDSGESLTDVIYAALTLKYQPYLADVLTVFVFLFLMAPGLLILERTCGQARLLALSFFVFVMWQPWAIGNTWQLNSHGAFDVNTWQFVFCLGIVAGSFGTAPTQDSNQKLWRVLLCCLIAVLAFGTVRLLTLTQQLPLFGEQLYGRHPLTLMRLLYISPHFLVVASATYIVWPKISRSRIAQIVVHFGRHSLLVFSVSVPLDYLARAFMDLFDAGIFVGILIICFEVSLLWFISQMPEYCRMVVRKQNKIKHARN